MKVTVEIPFYRDDRKSDVVKLTVDNPPVGWDVYSYNNEDGEEDHFITKKTVMNAVTIKDSEPGDLFIFYTDELKKAAEVLNFLESRI